VSACAPHVLQWCRRLGGARVDADDAAQEVLVVLFQRIGTVSSSRALGPWAFGITRRVLSDHRRRAWMRRWMPGALPDTADAPRQERSLEAARVRAALDTLSASQREAIVLCDIEEYTDDEAALLAGVPVGTLKSRLRVARARLQPLLREEDP
jgi:RNA polymerase sigma factor (sigma-70 family)